MVLRRYYYLSRPKCKRVSSHGLCAFHGQFCREILDRSRERKAMETVEILCRLFLLTACAHWAHCLDTRDADASSNFEENITTENTAVATTVQSFRHPRWYKRGSHDVDDDEDEHEHEMDHDDIQETKALSSGKGDYWGGYYDFLINEGSYKFWAVFQLATAALLIYSGFAAVYYAKVNPPTADDYEDYFLRRRRRRRRDIFLGLEPSTFQMILDAVSGDFQPHRASG